MDQIIEVSRHPSFKGIHHKVHPFLHHLHLGYYMRWNRISDGWATDVLSFWLARGIATFRPFLVPSLSASAFLVFLLGIHHRVLLVQLFLQIMILLGEAFYCCCEGLDLPLQGSRSRFFSLIVGGGCHRTSKYHATFCPKSGEYGLSPNSAFPQTAPTDDVKKSPVSHAVLTCSKQHLHNTKREDLTKSTSVVPAEYPPKVKLELLTTLECQSWGELCVPYALRVFGFL